MFKYRVREENNKFMATIESDGKAVDMVMAGSCKEAQDAKDAAEIGGWKDFAAWKPGAKPKKKKG